MNEPMGELVVSRGGGASVNVAGGGVSCKVCPPQLLDTNRPAYAVVSEIQGGAREGLASSPSGYGRQGLRGMRSAGRIIWSNDGQHFTSSISAMLCPPGAEPSAAAGQSDPIAQSFQADKNMLVSSISVFFNAIDVNNPNIWVSVREMRNGYPTDTDIERTDINLVKAGAETSADASIPFNIKFATPVKVTKGKKYCVVIGGWSPDTRVWVSKFGSNRIDTGEQITTETGPVNTESFFKSANGSTWNAEQYHDLKYALYCAKFTTTDMHLHFDSVVNPEPITESNPIECQAGSDTYRMHFRNHGMLPGDNFTLTLYTEATYELTLDRFALPDIGRKIYAQSGYGTIKEILASDAEKKTIQVIISEIKGTIRAGETFDFDVTPIVDSNNLIIKLQPDLTGVITNQPGDFNIGVPLNDFAKTFSVKSVDSPNSFIFDLGSVNKPNTTTRFGGDLMVIPEANIKYDIFNASALVYLNDGSVNWKAQGYGHSCKAFPKNDYTLMQPYSIELGKNIYLDAPQKLASDENEAAFIKGGKSFSIMGDFFVADAYNSPMINISSVSGIFISNNIGWFDKIDGEVMPNIKTYHPETAGWQGSEAYKYVTKTITLKNSADDINIVLDVCKDVNADFDLYYKVAYDHDNTQMDQIEWKKVPDFVKRDAARDEFIEHGVRLSEVVPGWTDALFNRFKVKIVGRTKNPSRPPIFKNLRVVATT